MPLCFRICSKNKKRFWRTHGTRMLSVTFNLVHVSAIVSARSNFLRLFRQEAYTLHIHTTGRRQESHPLWCQTHRVCKNGALAGECPCQGHQECDLPISDIVTWKHTDDTYGQLWADNNREKSVNRLQFYVNTALRAAPICKGRERLDGWEHFILVTHTSDQQNDQWKTLTHQM